MNAKWLLGNPRKKSKINHEVIGIIVLVIKLFITSYEMANYQKAVLKQMFKRELS